jgi:hypothetical protein
MEATGREPIAVSDGNECSNVTTRGLYVDSCRLLRANSGRSPTVRRTGHIDPLLPFEIGPMNGREARGADLPSAGSAQRVALPHGQSGCALGCYRRAATPPQKRGSRPPGKSHLGRQPVSTRTPPRSDLNGFVTGKQSGAAVRARKLRCAGSKTFSTEPLYQRYRLV